MTGSWRLLSMTMAILALPAPLTRAAEPWKRHAVDDSLRGADGVRLSDFDGDGLLDIVTGWEESGVIRLYLHPGYAQAADAWPAVTVGNARSPEDAVPVDLDGDGATDIVSCHEGKTRKLLVHWNTGSGDADANNRRQQLLDARYWQTDEFAAMQGRLWMFATSIAWSDGAQALVVGSKGGNAEITLLIPPPANRRRLQDWQTVRLRRAGWIMSLVPVDMDGDGDQDIVYSDRKGSRRGVGWLENPGPGAESSAWNEHVIGGADTEPMFLDASPRRVLVSTRDGLWLDCRPAPDGSWDCHNHPNPAQLGWGKAIRRLGASERTQRIVMTANTGDHPQHRQLSGVWLQTAQDRWQPIESPPGGKYDRIECLDLDGDGDADVLTCEERQNLGVIWYENPGQP